MEIIKKQLFESLDKLGGVDKTFIELTTKSKYRIIKKGKEDELVKFNWNEFFKWLQGSEYTTLFTNLKENKLAPLIDDDLLTPFDQQETGDIVDESSTKNQEQVILNSLKTFEGIINIIYHFLSATLDSKSSNTTIKLPTQLFEMLSTMHETILQFVNISERIVEENIYKKELSTKLKSIYSGISNDISQCCEIWIRLKKEGYQDIVPQTVSYLLAKSAQSGVIADISRLNKIRHGLTTIEYSDPNARTFIDLLLSCFIHPQFIKSEEGKKFLIYLFSVRPALIEQIHITVKGQLLHANKTTRDSYAEIYFKAWKVATGPFLLKIEYHCIQNLMEVAIHCSDPMKLGKSLFGFLHYFHNQKPYKEVDPMLYRLYEPILFRSLSVSNTTVRSNAARLFYDAFPLKKSNEDSLEVADSELSKQFKLLKDLFDDPSSSVRVIAIQGTFEILGKFWELIPLANSRSLLSKMINDLAFDKSSGSVREAVFIGCRQLLDNSLSHSTLKVLLPNVRNLIHDTSERVRETFADLLLFIKGISTIRFFDIVPVEHLLERMILDHKNTRLSKKFTQLIVELYFPQDAKKWDLINNCIQFFKSKRQAAFTFYSNLINFVPVLSVAKFVCTLFNYLVKFSNQNCDINELPISLSSNKTSKEGADGDDEDEEKEEEEEEVGVSVEDFESILEIISSILVSLKPLFSKQSEFQKTKASMLTVFNDEDVTSIYIWLFTSTIPRVEGMCKIIKIASQFSLENFPSLKELLIINFKEIDSTTPDILKETLLLCLFSWELPKQVLGIIIDSINLPLIKLFENGDGKELEESSSSSSKRKRKSKKSKKQQVDEEQPVEEEQPISFDQICEKANVSIVFLDMLFKNEVSRNKVIGEADSFSKIDSTFKSYLPIIGKKLAMECNLKFDEDDEENEDGENGDGEEKEKEVPSKVNNSILVKLDNQFLKSCFTMYAKVLFHCEALNDQLKKDSGYFSDIFEFGKFLFQLLQEYSKIGIKNKRIRSTEQEDDGQQDQDDDDKISTTSFELKNEKPFLLDILEIYLLIVTENITFGLCSSDTCIQMNSEISKILQISKNIKSYSFIKIIPTISKFSLQLYNYSSTGGDPRLQDSSFKLLLEIFDFINCNYKLFGSGIGGTGGSGIQSYFKLSEYLLVHHQKGSLNVIVKLLVEQMVWKEFNRLINVNEISEDDQIDMLEMSVLNTSNQFILNTISKSSPCINQIGIYLNSFVKSQSMNQKSVYYSLVLISILINNNLNSKTIDLSPLNSILINLISQLPSFVSLNEQDDDEDDEDETHKQLKLSTNSNIKYSTLLSISNDLFKLSTHDKEKEKAEKTKKTKTTSKTTTKKNRKEKEKEKEKEKKKK